MKWLKILLPLVFMVFASAASAEFYKYYDKKGNVHFTDDYNQVPEDQRNNVEGYEEYRRESEESTTSDQDPERQRVGTNRSGGDNGNGGKEVDFDSELKILDQRKAELAREYENLMQENAQLTELKQSVKTKADADSYNERVQNLNQNLKEHDRKRKEFFSDVEAYNARVAEENKARSKVKQNSQ
jgi:DNA repair exonuclease SbcCD ATPase subunit